MFALSSDWPLQAFFFVLIDSWITFSSTTLLKAPYTFNTRSKMYLSTINRKLSNGAENDSRNPQPKDRFDGLNINQQDKNLPANVA